MTEYLTDPENENNIENNNIENIEASENIGNVENIENIENIKKRILSALGLAARAGALVCGTDMICETLRKTPESNSKSNNNKNTAKNRKKVLLVIEASDTSDNTHKKLTDKCSYYKTGHIKTDNIDAATLAHAVGKSGGIAAVALTDENFVKLLKKAF